MVVHEDDSLKTIRTADIGSTTADPTSIDTDNTMFENTTITAIDVAILGTSLCISLAIGLYFANKNKSYEEYTSGGGKQSLLPVAISMAAAYNGTLTLIGNPTELYLHGIGLTILYSSAVIVWPISAFIFLPVFKRLNVLSVFHYVELRFSKQLRQMVSIIFILMMTLYSSVSLYLPSLSLYTVLGIPKVWSVGLIGTISVIYSSLGGLKAVVYTNLYHSILIFSSLVTVLLAGSMVKNPAGGTEVVGLVETFRFAYQGGRLSTTNEFFNLDLTTRQTVYNMIGGFAIMRCFIHGLSQMQIQSALSLPTLRKSQLSILLAAIIFFLCQSIASLIGVVIYKQFKDCDPFAIGNIKQRDELMFYYLTNHLNFIPAIQGLYIVGVLSSTLNQMSSFQSSVSTMVIEDFLRPMYFSGDQKSGLSDSFGAKLSKMVSFAFGMLVILLTVFVDKLDGLMQVSMTVFCTFGTPILAIFTLGVLTRFTNNKGMTAGLFVCFAFGLYIQYQQTYNQPSIEPSLPISIVGCPAAKVLCSPVFNGTTSVQAANGTFKTIIQIEEFVVPGEGDTTDLLLLYKNDTGNLIQVVDGIANENDNLGTYDLEGGSGFLGQLEHMSYCWLPLFIMLVSFAVSTPVSLLTGGLNQQVDERYLATFLSSAPKTVHQPPATITDKQLVCSLINERGQFGTSLRLSIDRPKLNQSFSVDNKDKCQLNYVRY